MKKLLLLAALLFAGASSAFAQQQGDVEFGLGASYLTKGEWLGLAGKARYGLLKNVRLDAGVTFYLPKSKASEMEMSLNAHYLLPIAEGLKLYPLAGVSYFHHKNGDFKKECVGANLGGGVSYQLSPSVSLGAEGKYVLFGDHGMPAVGVNVMFTL